MVERESRERIQQKDGDNIHLGPKDKRGAVEQYERRVGEIGHQQKIERVHRSHQDWPECGTD